MSLNQFIPDFSNLETSQEQRINKLIDNLYWRITGRLVQIEKEYRHNNFISRIWVHNVMNALRVLEEVADVRVKGNDLLRTVGISAQITDGTFFAFGVVHITPELEGNEAREDMITFRSTKYHNDVVFGTNRQLESTRIISLKEVLRLVIDTDDKYIRQKLEKALIISM